MTREEYIKKLAKEKYGNVKGLSQIAEIPYTTLLSMLKTNNSLSGSSVDSVIKICQALNITIEELNLTGKEKSLLDESSKQKELKIMLEKLDDNTLIEVEKYLDYLIWKKEQELGLK